MRNLTEAYEVAMKEAGFISTIERFTLKGKSSRAQSYESKLKSFLEDKKEEKEKVYFLFGDTFSKKEEIKNAGWEYFSGCWYSYDANLESFGFTKTWG